MLFTQSLSPAPGCQAMRPCGHAAMQACRHAAMQSASSNQNLRNVLHTSSQGFSEFTQFRDTFNFSSNKHDGQPGNPSVRKKPRLPGAPRLCLRPTAAAACLRPPAACPLLVRPPAAACVRPPAAACLLAPGPCLRPPTTAAAAWVRRPAAAAACVLAPRLCVRPHTTAAVCALAPRPCVLAPGAACVRLFSIRAQRRGGRGVRGGLLCPSPAFFLHAGGP